MKCKECPEYEACVRAFDLRKLRPHCPIAQSGKPVNSSSDKLMCNLFYCDRARERRCCSVCPRRDRCSNRCLNSPDRCGQAVEQVSGKAKGRIASLS